MYIRFQRKKNVSKYIFKDIQFFSDEPDKENSVENSSKENSDEENSDEEN